MSLQSAVSALERVIRSATDRRLSSMNEKDTSDGEGGILSSASSVNVLLKQGPPDGGLTAWLQVLGAFFMYFNTWGKPRMSFLTA